MTDIIGDNEIERWNEDDEEDISSNDRNVNELIKKYSDTQIRVVRTSLDLPLTILKANIGNKDYINIAPSFQRRGRWDLKKRSLLIESFLLNIPIPPVFFYENTYNQYEVMDGRQRIESIYEFLDNRFVLTGLKYWKEINGSRFNDLPDTIQRGLLRRTLNAIVLLTETDTIDDVDIRMELFNRLNTGGIQLNAHELRNATCPSHFNDLLKKLSREKLFTDLWKIPQKEQNEDLKPSKTLSDNLLYKTMLDCELVLRFFAIREVMDNKYKGSLRSVMDKSMKDHCSDTKSKCDIYEKMFLDMLQGLNSIYSGKSYVLLPDNKRYSRPLYDALTVAYSYAQERNLLNSSIDIPSSVSNVLDDSKKYDILIGKGNTIQAIKDRVNLMYNLITGMKDEV
jgi:hypothetical protein